MRFDVAIVGGGPVGAALAIALARGGLQVAVVENRAPTLPDEGRWDARVYALSPGSRDFVASLDAWQPIATDRISPINGMQVWGDDGKASIEFDSLEAGREDLGCIVEAGRLQLALWDVLRNEPGVTMHCPACCESLIFHQSSVELQFAEKETIKADLLVGADGPDSRVRAMAGLEAEMKPYGQMGVVANFATERSHGQIARQWFRDDGVLAWLPVPGNRISIVWSAPTTIAEKLVMLDSDVLCDQVAAAGNRILGRLECITPAVSFPLRQVDLPYTVRPCVALVGDAAHVVHPLAGQGVNLGLRDARMLAQVLLGRGRHESLGDLALLRRYERARREDWLATKWVTDGLHSLFNSERRSLAYLRNLGLNFANRLPGLKRRFMAHAVQ